MESIPNDLFTSILSYLPHKSIAALITNTNLDKAIKESAKTNIFWKQRVETLLGRYIEQNPSFAGLRRRVYPGWKIIYNNFIEDFGGKLDLKQDQMGVTHLINEQSSLFGSEALISSSINNHTTVAKILLADERVNPSTEDNSAIRMGSKFGSYKVVKLLLEDDRVNPSADNNFAIKQASRSNHPKVVKLLLEDDRVDPSADNNDSIIQASINGHSEVVKLLLADKRVDPSADDNDAIISASIWGYSEVVKLLMADERVNSSAKNNDAIMQASIFGRSKVVKLLLLDKRVDPSARNNSAIK